MRNTKIKNKINFQMVFLVTLIIGIFTFFSVYLSQLDPPFSERFLAASGNSGGGGGAGSGAGVKIGCEAAKTLQSIKKNKQGSKLTMPHILAVMCVENPKANMRVVNGEGRVEGLVQVIQSTFNTLINGECSYIKSIPGIQCSQHSDLSKDVRCSIEVGMCYYNKMLSKCRQGNDGYAAVCAYNGYNTGSINKRANNQYKFLQGYRGFKSGGTCNSSSRKDVWQGIMKGSKGGAACNMKEKTPGSDGQKGGSVEDQNKAFNESPRGQELQQAEAGYTPTSASPSGGIPSFNSSGGGGGGAAPSSAAPSSHPLSMPTDTYSRQTTGARPYNPYGNSSGNTGSANTDSGNTQTQAQTPSTPSGGNTNNYSSGGSGNTNSGSGGNAMRRRSVVSNAKIAVVNENNLASVDFNKYRIVYAYRGNAPKQGILDMLKQDYIRDLLNKYTRYSSPNNPLIITSRSGLIQKEGGGAVNGAQILGDKQFLTPSGTRTLQAKGLNPRGIALDSSLTRKDIAALDNELTEQAMDIKIERQGKLPKHTMKTAVVQSLNMGIENGFIARDFDQQGGGKSVMKQLRQQAYAGKLNWEEAFKEGNKKTREVMHTYASVDKREPEIQRLKGMFNKEQNRKYLEDYTKERIGSILRVDPKKIPLKLKVVSENVKTSGYARRVAPYSWPVALMTVDNGKLSEANKGLKQVAQTKDPGMDKQDPQTAGQQPYKGPGQPAPQAPPQAQPSASAPSAPASSAPASTPPQAQPTQHPQTPAPNEHPFSKPTGTYSRHPEEHQQQPKKDSQDIINELGNHWKKPKGKPMVSIVYSNNTLIWSTLNTNSCEVDINGRKFGGNNATSGTIRVNTRQSSLPVKIVCDTDIGRVAKNKIIQI